ncbi:D-alanyl-D-alanine carboxypeptidase/D-alanyl-D-alanine-endopeptidase [Mesoterricola silvestris]|uniref:D-alanyl-D-alanine carboxypeptidase/D-alanyl-D-alanine-endopeptidase n=1 Tax=Mesoterricola silvestris TaxID=2927979 RepID=A0AA48KBR7_9BACT|nr:D-alanyl-D-alanine carboxypeptidase [Mesoterricola silvestris]BDU74602.1 D-alanyl-D-alanine carboxypeptidase/D-alanyl-D-alanine-endopeptidase [Mesoterricola silvestris]
MIRCLLAISCLLATVSASADLPAWGRRMEARGIRASAGLWDLQTGKLLDGYDTDRALVPASTTKVLSTYALLKTWKPDYEIETEVWGDLRGGTVAGDLVLKGAGDPYLTSERIWLMAEELKARGVTAVRGRVRLDQSAFDGQRYGDGWENTSSNTTPPVLPLSVNFNRDRGRLVTDPERLATETLTRIFIQDGIAVEGAPAGEGQPRKLLAFHSPPLRDLVADINKFSNNFMIEMLVKRFGGGTWAQGVKQIQGFYSTMLGLGPDKVAITDGSGLSKENRLSARTLAIALRAAWNDFEVGPEMIASLKIIGGEPFRLHIKDPALARRVRVKTGHLGGVWSACGFLQTRDGKEHVFAILLNGDCAEGDVWDQIKAWAD